MTSRSIPGSRVEFVLQDAQEPHLFVIRKQQRRQAAARSADTLAAYYILDGSIYQAPTHPCCHFLTNGMLYSGAALGITPLQVSSTSPDVALITSCQSAKLKGGEESDVRHVLRWTWYMQDRSMYNMKVAFSKMQQDLDPLHQGTAILLLAMLMAMPY